MAKRKTKAKTDRYTRQQIAAMFKVRAEHFDKTYRQHIPANLIERVGRRVYFKPEAVRIVADAMVEAERVKYQAAEGDPMLAGGGDSPSLERYRAARAEEVEIKVAELRKQVVRVEDVEQLVGIVAARIRSAGGRLAKRFGKDARKLIEKALDEAQKEIETRFDSSD